MQTNLVYLNSVAAKNKDIFPNPEVFDPERWARDKPNPFALLLFGFGPRMCYGEFELAIPSTAIQSQKPIIYRKKIC